MIASEKAKAWRTTTTTTTTNDADDNDDATATTKTTLGACATLSIIDTKSAALALLYLFCPFIQYYHMNGQPGTYSTTVH